MIRRAEAIRFDRVVNVGRNRPLRVTADCNGEQIEVFLKASARPEMGVEGLANEVMAACLAADLNLPINEPLLIEMSAEWIASIPDAETRTMLMASSPIGFGSTAAGNQWEPWSAGNVLTAAQLDMGLQIFAFDAFIANDDRRVSNPNLLVKGESLRIIDHETAFRLALKLFPRPEPWRVGNLNHLVGDGGHIFAAYLKGVPNLEVEPVRAAWQKITDEKISDYSAALPHEWAQANEACDKALTHVRTVRDRIDDCLEELKRVLQ